MSCVYVPASVVGGPKRRRQEEAWRKALADDDLVLPDTSRFTNSFKPLEHRRLVDGVDFECRDAGPKGKGLFALAAVEPGAIVTTYTGDVLSDHNTHTKTHQLHVRGRRVVIDGLRSGGRAVSDAERFTAQARAAWAAGGAGVRYVLNDSTQGYGAFVNSTQDVLADQARRDLANVGVEFDANDRAYVVTTKTVQPGQELLWYYAVKL